MAAHAGEPEAQWLWGVYRQSGVPGDDEADLKGVNWMKKSACQYSVYGRMNYARAIARGLDKDTSPSLAINWYQTVLMDPFVFDAEKRDAEQFIANLNRSALAADEEFVDGKAAANFIFEQCYLDGNQNN